MAATGHVSGANLLDPIGAGFSSGVQNAFQAYLGPPKAMQVTDPYEKRPVTTFNMPEAYYGKSRFLREMVEDW